MPLPDLAVLAEGDLPAGQHWILRAGGTSTDFYTFLETVHPDGHRDEGGMGDRRWPTSGAVLATSLFGDVAAALREHGSATLDERCYYVRRPG